MSIAAKNLIDLEIKYKTGYLDLSLTGIQQIPQTVQELTWLKVLIVTNENIYPRYELLRKFNVEVKIDNTIYESLKNKDPWKVNKILSLPALSNLKSLEILIISGDVNNKYTIATIEGLNSLKNLKYLDLSFNEIVNLNYLSYFINLKCLNLSNNFISSISSTNTLKALKYLEEINLSNNRLSNELILSYFPETIKDLNLSSNNLPSLKYFSNSIKSLKLSQNKIYDLQNIEISKFQSIEELDLSSNNISTDLTILLNLNNLKSLNLSSNRIDILDELSFLLKEPIIQQLDFFLKISDNGFINKYLLSIKEDENHFEAIFNLLHLKGIETQKLDLGYSIKLLLLGNHAAGKSSLKSFLMNEIFPDNVVSTHILEINNITIYKNRNKLNLSIFDFGGQDFYHGIYKAFLSNFCLHIIVFNPQKDYNEELIDSNGQTIINFNRKYWIGINKYYSKLNNELMEPFIVVQNYEDIIPQMDKSINYNNHYTHFKWDTILSCNPNQSNSLIEKAKRFKEDLIRLLQEDKYFNKIESINPYIFKFIINLKNAGINHIEFKIILKEFLKDNSNINLIYSKINHSLIQLHRRGLILFYSKYNENPIDLDMKIVWITPLYIIDQFHKKILKKEFQENYKGIINYSLWMSFNYDINIVDILIKNKIIFLHKPENDLKKWEYIIPNYLSIDKKLWDMVENAIFILKFNEYIPFGLINQMICFYGNFPDKKEFGRYGLAFTVNSQFKITILLDIVKLEVKFYLDELSNRSKIQIKSRLIEYLFGSFILLYWNYDDIFDFNEYCVYYNKGYVNENKKKIWNNLVYKIDYIPDDLYISVDYLLFSELKTLYKLLISYFDIANDLNTNKVPKIIEYAISDYGTLEGQDASFILKYNSIYPVKKNILVKIFILYSHDDTKIKKEFEKYIHHLYNMENISIWIDSKILTGEEYEKEIRKAINNSNYFILLISQNTINSDFINKVEMWEIVKLHRKHGYKLFPIILEECLYENWIIKSDKKDASNDFKFGTLQCYPRDENNRIKPVSNFKNISTAFTNVVRQINFEIENILQT